MRKRFFCIHEHSKEPTNFDFSTHLIVSCGVVCLTSVHTVEGGEGWGAGRSRDLGY